MKPIGVYGLCNVAGIAVYDVDYFEDRILAGLNDGEPEWCEMWFDDDSRPVFAFHGMTIPLDEVMRV